MALSPEVPWSKVAAALTLQDFTVLDEVEGVVDGDALESSVPRRSPVLTTIDQDRQWRFIVERLRYLRSGSEILALRPDDKDLLLVVGRRVTTLDVEVVSDYVKHVEWVLRGLSRAARRLRPSTELLEAAEELGKLADIEVKLSPRSTDEQRAMKFALDLRSAQVVAGVGAARLALSLLRFRGQARCLILFGDDQVTRDEEEAWRSRSLRARKFLSSAPGFGGAVVEGWLWDAKGGRVIDAHRGLRARALPCPIPRSQPRS